MSPSRVRWGLTLIIIGGICLAINMNQLSWWVFLDFLYLWPVILIAIGLEMIVKKTRFQNLAYLSSVLMLGVFAWAIWSDGGLSDRGFGSDDRSDSVARLAYQNEQAVNLKANFDNGRFYVNSGNSDLIRVSDGSSKTRLQMTSNCSGGRCEVDLNSKERGLFRRSNFSSNDNYWKCYVNPAVDATYDFKLDEADLRLFADDLRVSSISIDAVQSDLLLKLSAMLPRVEIKLFGRSTDVDLVLPDSVGIRIEGANLRESTIASFNLIDRGGFFTNALYEIAPVNFNVVSTIDNGRMSLSTYERTVQVVDSI